MKSRILLTITGVISLSILGYAKPARDRAATQTAKHLSKGHLCVTNTAGKVVHLTFSGKVRIPVKSATHSD